MSTVSYKGLDVLATSGPSPGGLAISSNFRSLADRGPQNTIAGGRLTLTTNAPAPVGDQTSSTLYYTPDVSDQIAVYDGSSYYQLLSFPSQLTYSVSGLTANKNYDVFLANSSGTPSLELVAWTNDTTRATNLVRQGGAWYKTGALTRRYLGTVRTNGTPQFCDTATKGFVWNAYNQRLRRLWMETGTSYHVYDDDVVQYWNDVGTWKIEYVLGQPQDILIGVQADMRITVTNQGGQVGLGVDQDTTIDQASDIAVFTQNGFSFTGYASSGPKPISTDGLHYLALLENTNGQEIQFAYGKAWAMFLR